MDFTKTRKVNKQETKKEVERSLKEYKNLKHLLSIEGVRSLTVFSEGKREYADDYVNRVNHAMDGLTEVCKELIVEKYIKGDGVYDYVVKDRIRVAERTYYRIKDEALMELGNSLQITVYYEDDN